MEGIGTLIAICFLITFGPPALFLLIGLLKWKSDRSKAKIFLILGTVWLIIGGGACLNLIVGA